MVSDRALLLAWHGLNSTDIGVLILLKSVRSRSCFLVYKVASLVVWNGCLYTDFGAESASLFTAYR